MSDVPSHVRLWENGIREYEKLVYQTEKIQTKLPDSRTVFIDRSLVPKKLGKNIMKIHAAASYMATMEYILEQTSHKMDAHLDVIGNRINPSQWWSVRCLPR